MKNKFYLSIVITLLLILLSPVTKSYAQDNIRLKVVTFNIRSFEPDFDVTPYANILRDLNADIICLNEVENRSSRQQVNGKYRDVVQDIADKLSMFGIFGYSYNLNNKAGKFPESNYTFCENELYGNAILSKYPILSSNAFQLPRPESSADQRGVLTVDILLPSSDVIRAVATHLDHIGGQMEQAEVLVSDRVLDGKAPTILTGDMNVGPGSSVINKILTKFDRMDGDEGTYGGYSKIDFIFGSKNQWKLISSKTISPYYNEQELSDHWAVFSEIELVK